MAPKPTPHARLQEFGDFTTNPRVLVLAAMAIVVGSLGVGTAWVLLRLISLVTGIAYYGQATTAHGSSSRCRIWANGRSWCRSSAPPSSG